jgi:release factor glutamine methyltransferase
MRIPSNKIKDIVQFFRNELQGLYDENEIKSFVNIVMEEYTGLNRTQLLLSGDKTVSESVMLKIKFAINDLKIYKPVQYIIGKTIFYELEIKVNPSVLIPRPETEELVHWIISDYKELKKPIDIIDIGSGSGCIPIVLKKNLIQSNVYGIDISKDALKIAKLNALNNQTEVEFKIIDILDREKWIQLPQFDIIVSNPPYVCESEKEAMHANVLEYEPHLALFVDNDMPLIFYSAIADFALEKLKPNSSLYFEINEGFAFQTLELLKIKGFSNCEVRKDMQGKDRMIKAVNQ